MQGESRASLAQAKDDLDTLIGNVSHGGLSKADVTTLADQLFAVQHVLDREISLRRAFTDPSSTPAARAGLARSLFGGADRRDRARRGGQPGQLAVGGAARHRRRGRAARRAGALHRRRGGRARSTTSRTSCSGSVASSTASRRCCSR